MTAAAHVAWAVFALSLAALAWVWLAPRRPERWTQPDRSAVARWSWSDGEEL